MKIAFTKFTDELEHYLRSTTSKVISDTVMETCRAIPESREWYLVETWEPQLKAAAVTQITAGPRALIGGSWTKDWSALQKEHYDRTRSTKLTSVRLAKTISKVQQILFGM